MEYQLTGQCYLDLNSPEAIELMDNLLQEGKLWEHLSKLFEDSVRSDIIVTRMTDQMATMQAEFLRQLQQTASPSVASVSIPQQKNGVGSSVPPRPKVEVTEAAPPVTGGSMKSALSRMSGMKRK